MTEQARADPPLASRWRVAEFPVERAPIGRLAGLAVVALALGAVCRAYLVPPALPLDVVLLDWAPIATAPVAVAYHLDGLSLLFAGLVALASLAVAVSRSADRAASASVALPVLGLIALLCVVLSGDLIILYVSWEALGLIAYLAQRADRSAPGLVFRRGRGEGCHPEPQRRVSSAPAAAEEMLRSAQHDTTPQPQPDRTLAPYAVGHLTGYGLLAAALIAGQSSGGVFSLGSLPADAWGGAALMLVAALGRLFHASAGPASRSFRHELCRVQLTLSGAYLLLRALGAGPGSLAGWATALLLVGGLLLLAGCLYLNGLNVNGVNARGLNAANGLKANGLKGADALELTRRWVWIDAGLLLVAAGIGGPLAFGAGLLLVLNQALARLPAAVDSAGTEEPGALGAGLAFGSLAGLPPLPGYAARWLLVEAAWQQGMWPLVLPLVVAAALATRAGLAALRPGTRRDVASPAVAGAGWLVAALPILVASLVPALVGRLVGPALALAYPDQIGSAVAAIEAGPTWPALLLALLGPGAGLALYAARGPGDEPRARRGRAVGASAARLRALAGAVRDKAAGLSGRLERGIAWLEAGPYAAALVVFAVVALVVLAL